MLKTLYNVHWHYVIIIKIKLFSDFQFAELCFVILKEMLKKVSEFESTLYIVDHVIGKVELAIIKISTRICLIRIRSSIKNLFHVWNLLTGWTWWFLSKKNTICGHIQGDIYMYFLMDGLKFNHLYRSHGQQNGYHVIRIQSSPVQIPNRRKDRGLWGRECRRRQKHLWVSQSTGKSSYVNPHMTY